MPASSPELPAADPECWRSRGAARAPIPALPSPPRRVPGTRVPVRTPLSRRSLRGQLGPATAEPQITQIADTGQRPAGPAADCQRLSSTDSPTACGPITRPFSSPVVQLTRRPTTSTTPPVNRRSGHQREGFRQRHTTRDRTPENGQLYHCLQYRKLFDEPPHSKPNSSPWLDALASGDVYLHARSQRRSPDRDSRSADNPEDRNGNSFSVIYSATVESCVSTNAF